eukprot:94214-Prymnesium_polylepis.1
MSAIGGSRPGGTARRIPGLLDAARSARWVASSDDAVVSSAGAHGVICLPCGGLPGRRHGGARVPWRPCD